MTSWPMRGMWMAPHCLPAHGVATRTQQELSASFLPSRSQWNCTFTRPYLSVKISSPGWPDHDGGLRPLDRRRGVTRGGRYGRPAGMHVKWFW